MKPCGSCYVRTLTLCEKSSSYQILHERLTTPNSGVHVSGVLLGGLLALASVHLTYTLLVVERRALRCSPNMGPKPTDNRAK
jgi:hypothetical protein